MRRMHDRGQWTYLLVGGAYHGKWKELDQSWFWHDSVNLPVVGSGFETYYRRRVHLDTDGSYIDVLTKPGHTPGVLMIEVWDLLERWKRIATVPDALGRLGGDQRRGDQP